MKEFGERLKLQEMRMVTIKDKLENFAIQVSSFMELPDEPEKTEDLSQSTTKIYTAEDSEDPIDVLVEKSMTDKFAGISISR